MAFEKLNIPNKELYLIGNYDNNYSNYLFDFINSNKIKNIHFLGQQQNPDFFINSSKLFVSTSKAEGFSNSILEALSFGIPVVASNVGGNIEIIKNGFNGYIYNLGDIDDLCDKIELVYERSLNDVNLSDNCKTVLCDFSLDKMIDNYLKIYL
jgi:glycosyltransferase involved in cell wall biosynthesis